MNAIGGRSGFEIIVPDGEEVYYRFGSRLRSITLSRRGRGLGRGRIVSRNLPGRFGGHQTGHPSVIVQSRLGQVDDGAVI